MPGFAVVGLGMGRNRARMIAETAAAELKIVVDLKTELAREVADEMGCDWSGDLEDALGRRDVDVVLVMTPSGSHADVGVRAAEAGKHVITTKPMDVSTAACDRLIAAGEAAGVKIGVDYQSRYVDNNVRVARALREGLLGKPILGEVRFKWFRSDAYFAENDGWRGTWKMDGGGSLANQGSHLLDLLLWFMGDPDRVYGETVIANHKIETEDVGLAIINFTSGAKGVIAGTTTFPKDAYFSAEVHGTDGGVLITDALQGEMQLFGEGLEQRLSAFGNGVQNVIEDMVAVLETDGQLRVTGPEGRRTVALLEAIYASARSGTAMACE
jgi:predicted dehydrogenase